MRRILVMTLALTTAAASTAAFAAAPSSGRQVVRSYTAATTAETTNGDAQGTGVVLVGGPVHGKVGLQYVHLRPTDRTATVQLTDQTGRTVKALVQQTTKSGRVVRIGLVCGATSKPLALADGAGTLVIRPAYGACGQEPSVPTTGEIRVTLR